MRDIINKMKKWISQGELLILLLDTSEESNNGNLARAIRSDPKIKMKDLIRERARKDGPDTLFHGTKHIDDAFNTPDMDCCGVRFLPFLSVMEDHSSVVGEILHQYVLGEQVSKVVCPEDRRLQCGLTGPKRWYLQKRKKLFQEHKV